MEVHKEIKFRDLLDPCQGGLHFCLDTKTKQKSQAKQSPISPQANSRLGVWPAVPLTELDVKTSQNQTPSSNKIIALYLLLLISHFNLLGQVGVGQVSYDTIAVGYTTSVNLIFDSSVKQWDMGLGVRVEDGRQVWDVLVENSMESPNRIKLAAGIQEFKTTNLFVETSTAYYNFILTYEPIPQKLLYQISIGQAEILKTPLAPLERGESLRNQSSLGGEEHLASQERWKENNPPLSPLERGEYMDLPERPKENHTLSQSGRGEHVFEDSSPLKGRETSSPSGEGEFDTPLAPLKGGTKALDVDSVGFYSQVVMESNGAFSPIGKSSQQILFFLSGIYIQKDHLYFKLYIQNSSTIPFDIGFIGFFKGDRGLRGNKKRPRQEEHLTPEFILHEKVNTLESNGEVFKVYVFKKFTLSKHKRLYIQLWEGNQGERKMELKVRGKDVLRAAPLASPQPSPRGEGEKW